MTKQSITNNIKIPNKDMYILRKSFPQCFDKNGNFDFDKFRQELLQNEDIDFSNESYGMDWLGKSYARLLASDEAKTLLKEDKDWNQKEENKSSENLLIKGDNLEVLKHLSNAYYESIKMIYIDPPYNTGSDGFVYEDDRKFTVEELTKLAGVDEEKAQRILDFTQSKSNSHSAWLTFMYPRLYIAKQLLKDDGVIFVSIDDNEIAQLKILMDEVFGEEDFVAQFPRITTIKGKNDEKMIATSHDYVLMYSRIGELNRNEDFRSISRYKLEDKNGKYYVEATLDSVSLPYSESLDFEIEIDGKKIMPIVYNGKKTCWRWSKDLVEFGLENNLIVNKNGRLYTKTYLDLEIKKKNGRYELVKKKIGGTYRSQLLLDYKFSNNEASRALKELKIPFNYPKPVSLIKQLFKLVSTEDDIALDFFAGSGTTGDAVMQLNSEDGENRKYILVQLPEKIDQKKNKTAYDFVKKELKIENPTIFEITKERLVRAAKKIREDNKKSKEPKDLSKMDFGFKIFETTPIWKDYNLEAEVFDPQAKLFDESKLTKEDLDTLLTTWKTFDGFSLTQELKEINFDGYKGYYLENKLYLMNKGFETKNLKKLLEEIDSNKDFNPATIIVFGYNFQSKALREIADNVKNYANKKQIEVDFITRY
jgi:adenine-specific DNA-methyltransferase